MLRLQLITSIKADLLLSLSYCDNIQVLRQLIPAMSIPF